MTSHTLMTQEIIIFDLFSGCRIQRRSSTATKKVSEPSQKIWVQHNNNTPNNIILLLLPRHYCLICSTKSNDDLYYLLLCRCIDTTISI